MIKNLVQLAVVLLLIAGVVALAGAGKAKSAFALWVGLASFGSIALLYWFDRDYDKKVKARKDAEDEKRLSDLSRRKGQKDVLEVSGSSHLALALSATAMGALVIYLFIPFPNAIYISVGILMLAMGCLVLLGAIPAVGKPIITISGAGFKTPLTPLLTWDLVNGIHLQKITMRHGIVYRLVFRIETLQQLMPGFGMFHRLLYRFRSQAGKAMFHVALKETAETPDFIYKLARQYWTAKTGRTHDWNPDWSEEMNRSMKDMDELDREFKEMKKSGALMPPDPAAFSKFSERLARIDKGFSVEMGRSERRFKWLKVTMYVALALLAISVILKIFAKL